VVSTPFLLASTKQLAFLNCSKAFPYKKTKIRRVLPIMQPIVWF